MPNVITQQEFEKRAQSLSPGMTKLGLARSLVSQGYQLEGMQVPASVVQQVAENGHKPGFIRQFIDSVTAPADLAAGVVQKGLANIAGIAGLKRMEQFVNSTDDVQQIGENYRQSLGVAPLYGGVIGAGVGAPGLGAAAGQAIQEAGLAAIGENQNSPLQAAGNIALSGVAGKIAGGGKGIYSTGLRAAGGEALIQGGRDIMGNNQLSEGDQFKAVGMAGLFGAGASAASKIAPPTIQGGVSGGPSGAAQGFGKGLKDVGSELVQPFVRGQRKMFNVLGFKLSPLEPDFGLDTAIDETVAKALKPSIGDKGKTAFTQERFDENARKALKDLAANKEQIQITGPDGTELPIGTVPQTLGQLQEANDHMLKGIASRMHALHEFATKQGLTISGDDVADELEKFASKKTIYTRNAQLASRAQTLASNYRGKTFSPDEAQDILAQANNELQAFNRNPNPNDIGTSVLTSLEKNVLDKSLNNAVMGVADNNPIFKELKRSYAAQKAIQATINRRYATYVRQNPAGLIDYTGVYTADAAANAIINLNPAAAGSTVLQTAYRAFIKYKNSPDTMIKSVFKTLNDYQLGKPILTSADDALATVADDIPLSEFSPQGVADAAAAKEAIKNGMSARDAAKISGSPLPNARK
jgi:hypothetical protein